MISHRRTGRHAVLSLVLFTLLIAGILPAAAQTGTPLPPVTPTPSSTPIAMPTFEMVGLVEAVTATTLTVNGQVIQIVGAEMNQMPVVGAAVKVEGFMLSTGQLAAREVKTVDLTRRGLRPGEIELVAPLTALTQTTLTIAGLSMDVTNAEFGRAVAVGALVKVHATLNAQGQWIVREVELATEDDLADDEDRRDGEFEMTGTLTEVGADFVVINGQRISTVGAEIKGLLVVGALVKVHLSIDDGVWIAREVELADRDDDRDFEDEDEDDDRNDDENDDRNDDHSDDRNDDQNDDHGDDQNDDHGDDGEDDGDDREDDRSGSNSGDDHESDDGDDD